MSPNVTSADAVVLGGGTSSGIEEKPQIRYETTDKDGVSKVTAVLSRRIHCLAVHAEAIKQSIAFPGQIVEVAGQSYGAGWVPGTVTIVPNGETAIVQVEARREGVTPFEWGLPPRLSMEMADGVATMYYTTAAGTKVQMLQWDSRTGEDRYGWRVNYFEAQKLTYANTYGEGSRISIHSMLVFYENREMFRVEGEDALASVSSRLAEGKTELIGRLANGGAYPTAEAAQAAGEAVLAGWIEGLKADIAAGAKFSNYGTRFISGLASIDEALAVVTSDLAAAMVPMWSGPGYFYKLSVPSRKIIADVPAWKAEFAKGLRWEAITDLDEASATYLHVFYRLRYAGVILFAIDVTAAEVLT